jgi:hypothetical protein
VREGIGVAVSVPVGVRVAVFVGAEGVTVGKKAAVTGGFVTETVGVCASVAGAQAENMRKERRRKIERGKFMVGTGDHILAKDSTLG